MMNNAVRRLILYGCVIIPPITQSCHTAKETNREAVSVDMTGRRLGITEHSELQTNDTIFHLELDTANGRLTPKRATVVHRHHTKGGSHSVTDTAATVKNTSLHEKISHSKGTTEPFTPPFVTAIAAVVALLAVAAIIRATKM